MRQLLPEEARGEAEARLREQPEEDCDTCPF